MSALQEPSSIEKVVEIDSHIGAAMSGLTPDARTLVDHARVEAQVTHCSLPLTLNSRKILFKNLAPKHVLTHPFTFRHDTHTWQDRLKYCITAVILKEEKSP